MSFNITPYNKSADGIVMNMPVPRNKKIGFDPKLHHQNINRRIMERGKLFNMDTRHNKFHDSNLNSEYGSGFATESDVGEITGKMFETDDLEQGMPVRTYLDEHKPTEPINPSTMYNHNLDTDLFDSKAKINVSYFDPFSGQNSSTTSFSSVTSTNSLLPPIERIDGETKLSASINMFSINLLNRLQKVLSDNIKIVISPLNIFICLSILYRGSKGQTENEIGRTLFSLNKDSTIKTLQNIVRKLDSNSINIISMLLFSENFPLNRGFTDHIKDLGLLTNIDNSRSRQEMIKINNIIKEHTKGKIVNIITPQLINFATSLVIISSVSFRSRWKYQFPKRLMNYDVFFGRKRRETIFMSNNFVPARYFEDNINKVVELDFYMNGLAMGFILPKSRYGLFISSEQLGHAIGKLNSVHIKNLKIPKFTHRCKYNINNMLQTLGIRDLFFGPDLSDITPNISNYGDSDELVVNDFIHEVIVEVNEVGVEKTFNKQISTNINFIANHPFIYYIRYVETNTIVVTGCYY